jgi:hypothetical protein
MYTSNVHIMGHCWLQYKQAMLVYMYMSPAMRCPAVWIFPRVDCSWCTNIDWLRAGPPRGRSSSSCRVFGLLIVQTGSGAHTASYPMHTGWGGGGFLHGRKAAEAWNWSLTSNNCRGPENVYTRNSPAPSVLWSGLENSEYDRELQLVGGCWMILCRRWSVLV